MKRYIVTLSLLGLALVAVGAGCATTETADTNTSSSTANEMLMPRLSDFEQPPTQHPGILADEDRLNRSVVIKTDQGDITLELYGKDAPLAVSNFLVLAQTGFYDGVIFHRVIENFMIQGGDPTGTGSGGPGYRFNDELGGAHTTYERGTLAMANAGPNTNGSQFFIMHQDTALPNLYSVFGRVTAGQDIVDAIATSPTGAADRPENPPVIQRVEIQ